MKRLLLLLPLLLACSHTTFTAIFLNDGSLGAVVECPKGPTSPECQVAMSNACSHGYGYRVVWQSDDLNTLTIRCNPSP